MKSTESNITLDESQTPEQLKSKKCTILLFCDLLQADNPNNHFHWHMVGGGSLNIYLTSILSLLWCDDATTAFDELTKHAECTPLGLLLM